MPRPMRYDADIRLGETGERVYTAWRNMRRHHPYDPIFEDYPTFYRWAIQAGFVPTARLTRHNKELPHSPTNSVWVDYGEKESLEPWMIEWCKKWDKTVARLRKQFGLPPLEEDYL